jgi:hypothetical protein
VFTLCGVDYNFRVNDISFPIQFFASLNVGTKVKSLNF